MEVYRFNECKIISNNVLNMKIASCGCVERMKNYDVQKFSFIEAMVDLLKHGSYYNRMRTHTIFV